jgi:hypothetical protein
MWVLMRVGLNIDDWTKTALKVSEAQAGETGKLETS